MNERSIPTPDSTLRHEPPGTNVKGIVLFLVILAVGMGLIHLSIYGFMRLLKSANPAQETMGYVEERPEDHYGAKNWEDPGADLQELRQKEDRRLHSYEWIDSQRGVVRIPIERAMQILSASPENEDKGIQP